MPRHVPAGARPYALLPAGATAPCRPACWSFATFRCDTQKEPHPMLTTPPVQPAPVLAHHVNGVREEAR